MRFFLHTSGSIRIIKDLSEYRCSPDEFQALEPGYPGLPAGVILRYQTDERTFLDTGTERQEDTVDALQYCEKIGTYPPKLINTVISPFLFPFSFYGPVRAGMADVHTFPIDLRVQRVHIFCQRSGTTGDNLELDIRIDGVSILSVTPTIAPGSRNNVVYDIPDTGYVSSLVPAGSLLSVRLLTTPDDAESITADVWLRP